MILIEEGLPGIGYQDPKKQTKAAQKDAKKREAWARLGRDIVSRNAALRAPADVGLSPISAQWSLCAPISGSESFVGAILTLSCKDCGTGGSMSATLMYSNFSLSHREQQLSMSRFYCKHILDWLRLLRKPTEEMETCALLNLL